MQLNMPSVVLKMHRRPFLTPSPLALQRKQLNSAPDLCVPPREVVLFVPVHETVHRLVSLRAGFRIA